MKQKILVIEDNREVLENISEILELSEYAVVMANDGKAGVEAALKEPFDLIICDIMMPLLDGYGVLHLLNRHQQTRNIPFIFLTAKSEKADLRKGMELGADDYLTKPFDGTELLNAVEVRLKKNLSNRQDIEKGIAGINQFINEAGRSGEIQLTSADRPVDDYKKKHILYSEGQRPRVLYYIVKGKVKIYKINAEGKELIIQICNDGDFFGYTSILEEVNYQENAAILEDSSLMLIPAAEFLQLVTSDTSIARQFIRLIVKNVISKEEDLLNLAYNSLRKKVAYGLVQYITSLKEADKKTGTLNLSRKEMAQMIGVATESFIRTIADFKTERLLDIIDGKIIILNENKLRNLPN
jgi:CRP/FNR family cyclic AMP-dependent transcriptional regulator